MIVVFIQSSAKKKKEIERCNQMINRFKEEEKKQTDHVARVMARLEHDKDQWFKSGNYVTTDSTKIVLDCDLISCCLL